MNSQPQSLDADVLGPVVRGCLHDAGAEILAWRQRPLPSWSLGEATAGIFHVEGRARTGNGIRTWSLVLKGLRDQGDGLAWRTEADFYASARSRSLPRPLRAPKVLAVVPRGAREVWIGMESVPTRPGNSWTCAALAEVARGLGRFQGSPMGRPGPGDHAWLRGLGLLGHVEERDLHVAYIAAEEPWAHPGIREAFPSGLRQDLLRLWAQRRELCAALEDLPMAFTHGDAHPMNLLQEPSPEVGPQAVLVDWGSAGLAPLGVEAQALVAGALATFTFDPGDARALDRSVFEAYREGLGEAGLAPDPVRLRLAHAAAACLLWALPLAGRALRAAVDAGFREAIVLRAGRPYEALLAQRAASLAFLMELAQEASGLMADGRAGRGRGRVTRPV